MDALPLDERIAFAREIASRFETLPHVQAASDADAEATYAIAYNLFVAGNYEAALESFRLLVSVRPASRTYLLGAALCMQRLHRYAEAILGFKALGVMDPADPAHLLACAECQLLAQQREEAKATLAQVIEECGAGAAHEAVRARAQAMLDLLRTHHESAPA